MSRQHEVSSSEFLAAGAMQWQEEVALPADMSQPCALAITATSFLAIYGTDIRKFYTAIAGPTSSEGWREAGDWPKLKTLRTSWPGCAKIGQKVIKAGRHNGGLLSSTEVLNLIDRRISSEREMASPRNGFHLAKIISGGEEKDYLSTVEEWVETSSTWKAADYLIEGRRMFVKYLVYDGKDDHLDLICTLNAKGSRKKNLDILLSGKG